MALPVNLAERVCISSQALIARVTFGYLSARSVAANQALRGRATGEQGLATFGMSTSDNKSYHAMAFTVSSTAIRNIHQYLPVGPANLGAHGERDSVTDAVASQGWSRMMRMLNFLLQH